MAASDKFFIQEFYIMAYAMLFYVYPTNF